MVQRLFSVVTPWKVSPTGPGVAAFRWFVSLFAARKLSGFRNWPRPTHPQWLKNKLIFVVGKSAARKMYTSPSSISKVCARTCCSCVSAAKIYHFSTTRTANLFLHNFVYKMSSFFLATFWWSVFFSSALRLFSRFFVTLSRKSCTNWRFRSRLSRCSFISCNRNSSGTIQKRRQHPILGAPTPTPPPTCQPPAQNDPILWALSPARRY